MSSILADELILIHSTNVFIALFVHRFTVNKIAAVQPRDVDSTSGSSTRVRPYSQEATIVSIAFILAIVNSSMFHHLVALLPLYNRVHIDPD